MRRWTSVVSPTVVELKVSLVEVAAVGAVVQEVLNGGSRILSLKKVEPSLEDVFVALVGAGMTTEEAPR
jgi:ABC-2 type transport system ATP-binding protein